jgi:diguanylate cyclase (GGDEF)-like protein
MANKDFLTQVWNRRYMDRRVQEFFSLARRHGHELSLVYLDADHFKKINDTYGHAAGDEVLKSFAAIMQQQIRDTDLVARVGGEEFVLVLPETGIEGALQVATKLRENIKAFEFLGDKRIKMTASIGVMTLSEDPGLSSSHDLIEAADKYAYQSKTGGRDRISSPRGQIA